MFIFDKAVFIRKSQVIKAVLFRVVCIGSGSVVNIEPYPARFRQCFHGNGNLILDAEALSGSKASQVNRKAFPVLVETRCQGFGRSRGARLGVIQERTLHILDIRQYRFRGGTVRIIEGIRNPDIFQGKLVAAVCLPGNRIGDGIASVLIANRIGRGFVQNESCLGLQVRAGAVFRVLGCKSIRLIGYQLAFTVLNKGIAVFEQDPVAEGTGLVGSHVADFPDHIPIGIQADGTVGFSYGNGFAGDTGAGEDLGRVADTNISNKAPIRSKTVRHLDLGTALCSRSDGQRILCVVAVRGFHDFRGNRFCKRNLAGFGSHILLKVRDDCNFSKHKLRVAVIIDSGWVNPAGNIERAADGGGSVVCLLSQPIIIKINGQNAVADGDIADFISITICHGSFLDWIQKKLRKRTLQQSAV